MCSKTRSPRSKPTKKADLKKLETAHAEKAGSAASFADAAALKAEVGRKSPSPKPRAPPALDGLTDAAAERSRPRTREADRGTGRRDLPRPFLPRNLEPTGGGLDGLLTNQGARGLS